MRVLENHRLEGVQFLPSPNCDERSAAADVTLVVIHCISLPRGEFGSKVPSALFTNSIDFDRYEELKDLDGLRVSAHVLVERNGEVTQFVPFDKRAWHAGVSTWQGRTNCNDFSIGIELEGTDDSEYEDIQYDVLTAILTALFARYSAISFGNVVGHAEIAAGRKTDPGPLFDWRRLFSKLAKNVPSHKSSNSS